MSDRFQRVERGHTPLIGHGDGGVDAGGEHDVVDGVDDAGHQDRVHTALHVEWPLQDQSEKIKG